MGKKLQCKVSEALAKDIGLIMIQTDKKKGATLLVLVKLALDNQDHPSRNYGSSEVGNCTLELSDKEWDRSKAYRQHHNLTAKTSFFRDALARGASVYLDSKSSHGRSKS